MKATWGRGDRGYAHWLLAESHRDWDCRLAGSKQVLALAGEAVPKREGSERKRDVRRYSQVRGARRHEDDGKADSSGSHRAGGVRLGSSSRASGGRAESRTAEPRRRCGERGAGGRDGTERSRQARKRWSTDRLCGNHPLQAAIAVRELDETAGEAGGCRAAFQPRGGSLLKPAAGSWGEKRDRTGVRSGDNVSSLIGGKVGTRREKQAMNTRTQPKYRLG